MILSEQSHLPLSQAFSMALNIPHKLFLKATEHLLLLNIYVVPNFPYYKRYCCVYLQTIGFPSYFGSFERDSLKKKHQDSDYEDNKKLKC